MVILFQLTLVFLLFWVSPAFAKNYWVHPSGNASWTNCQSEIDPGSSYCSLSTANRNAMAGDTVYLKAGTYTLPTGGFGIAPANSGSGAGAGRIIYSRAPGEEKPLITGGSIGIELSNRSYIKVDGIRVQRNTGYSAHLEKYSHHNEIANCEFFKTAIFMIRAMCGNSPETYTCNSTHNWIHHNTFGEMTPGGPCTEGGDSLRLGQPWYGDGNNNYNTIEDNIFAHSGHGTIDSYGFHYAVIKNNITRNEPWWTGPGVGEYCPGKNWRADYSNNAYDNKWGHRNFQVGFTPDGSNSYSLVEGNRLGYQSPNPGNPGDSNLSIAGRGMLVRYNKSFGAMRMGMYFKYALSSQNGLGGTNCRVYNNTIYRSGYGFDGGGAPATRRDGFTFDLAAAGVTGNHVKNNIIYDSRDSDLGRSAGSFGSYNEFAIANITANNWCTNGPKAGCTAWGNPSFVDTTLNPSLIATLPNLSLNTNSPAIDGGTYLAQATNSGNESDILAVNDVLYFQDGTWGSNLARGITHFPDWIAIGTVDNVVQISSIDYSKNTIILANRKTWSMGAKIWLYKKSDGKQVLHGTAPDYGAYEYGISAVKNLEPEKKSISPPTNVRTIN